MRRPCLIIAITVQMERCHIADEGLGIVTKGRAVSNPAKSTSLPELFRFCLTSSGSQRRLVYALAASLVFSLIGGVGNVAILTLLARLLASPHGALAHKALLILLLGILVGLARAVVQAALAEITTDVLVGLRRQLSISVSKASLETVEQIGSATLTSCFTEMMPSITMAFSQIPNFALQIITILGGACYLAWLSWRTSLIVVLVSTPFFFFYTRWNLRASEAFAEALASYRHILQGFQELVQGARELKLNRAMQEDHMELAVETPLRTFHKFRKRSLLLYGMSDAWSVSLLFALISLVIGVNGWKEAHANLAFILTLVFIASPIQSAISALPSFSQARLALAEIRSISRALAEGADSALLNHQRITSWSTISFHGVRFSHRSSTEAPSFTVGPLDLSFNPGETIFVVGSNGSGKTTFLKLLTGLYQPSEGDMSVDGMRVGDETISAYRQLFSAIFADHFLFDRLYGVKENAELISAYLELMELETIVSVKDRVFSTIRLSHGQRKRLALLRTLLEDRPIYVFDEWAAEQDPRFREKFYSKILPLLKDLGKTVIVVTHDDRYYHIADRILRFDHGMPSER